MAMLSVIRMGVRTILPSAQARRNHIFLNRKSNFSTGSPVLREVVWRRYRRGLNCGTFRRASAAGTVLMILSFTKKTPFKNKIRDACAFLCTCIPF